VRGCWQHKRPRRARKNININAEMLIPRIETLAEKKLVGKSLPMSFADDKTFMLWRSFMPERKSITNALSGNLFSLQVYPDSFDFKTFSPLVTFTKWAAMEVTNFDALPAGMESFTLAGGLYAVFDYIGAASAGQKTFEYIFKTWLPASDYDLDNRPHFEILGKKYKREDPTSEEEIWIPIKLKSVGQIRQLAEVEISEA
jgi:AraC family transcriptional regulator